MQEFIDIFAQMGWVSGILLVAGALLFLAECLTPGFGVAGIVGGICLVLGIIARVVEGATLTQTLLLLILVLLLACVAFIVFAKSAKNGLLSKTPIIEAGTAIPENYGKIANTNLLNKIGTTKSICRPTGKVEVEGRIYDAMTDGQFIDANKNVQVVKVEFDYLYIKETNLTQAELDKMQKSALENEQEKQESVEVVATKQKQPPKAKTSGNATKTSNKLAGSAKANKGGSAVGATKSNPKKSVEEKVKKTSKTTKANK